MGAKPEYTKKQKAAIDLLNRNLLISAAAGSGKTAVLVQRIINRILDEKDPVDIDRILVMTFTRAAAAQMKERILNAINEKRIEDPHNKNLSRQYALVHSANIMTIDSFCLSVVRNHFEEIDLSPDFRMADEGEKRLLEQDVFEEVLEEFYEEGDEGFLRMTEVFSAKKTDAYIEKLVLSLYNYAESYPDPIAWLTECTKEYEKCENVSELNWLENYVNQIRGDLNFNRKIAEDSLDICNMPYGPDIYSDAAESDISLIDALLNFTTYDELYNKCLENSDYSFTKLPRLSLPKEGEASEEEIEQRKYLKERFSSLRDKNKKELKNLLGGVSSSSPEEILDGMRMMSEHVSWLVRLVKAFIVRLDEKKRAKNLVDFNDLEHMCLNILKKGEDTVAAQYRDFFTEIYVDEYQDSNFVQEEIVNLIAKRSDTCGNVFMVGDVKQSIYGFRNAKPEIFVEKYNRFNICPDEVTDKMICEVAAGTNHGVSDELPRDIRIDLSDNFRSREEVLYSVNNIFEKIMKRELGGIEYDDAAALHPGRKFTETECDYKTELLLCTHDDEVDDREEEALMLARKIKDMMKNTLVEGDEGMRPLKYSDIVILLRTAKGWDNLFMDVLKSQGIPVFVTSSTGYFEALEIKTLLNYLKIIDNPLQDIPLAAVMMSVIGNFSEEEIARIRAAFKDGYLYSALVSFEDTYPDDAVTSKISRFLRNLYYYRKKSEYTPVEEILTEIVDGDYGKIIKAMPLGAKRYANLNMLLRKAYEFGKTSYKGIFQFNRYIEALRKYDIDYGEANIIDESDDTVRIMSIHKSKGLEFPVCFLAGMSKKFNFMDTNDSVLTDSAFGIATDIVDIDRRVKTKSPFKATISRKKKRELIAEELRLLYVAMTRAKEKLILTGSVKDENVLTDSIVSLEKASSYLDMYMCAAENGEVDGIKTHFYDAKELIDEMVLEETTSEVKRNALLSILYGAKNSEADSTDSRPGESADNSRLGWGVDNRKSGESAAVNLSEIDERIKYIYPHEDKGYVKLSVSELKKRSQEQQGGKTEESDLTEQLYENSEGGRSLGALHGSAVHRIFEIWDYNRPATEESVRNFLSYVHDEKLIEDELLELVRVDEVVAFVSSDLAQRMKKAFQNGNLRREQPFVICDDQNDSESMLIQGIIDAYFIEDGEIVLVDYKTDKVKDKEKLIEKYKIQLDYYGKALSRLLHLNLKESVIYSTFLKKSISI